MGTQQKDKRIWVPGFSNRDFKFGDTVRVVGKSREYTVVRTPSDTNDVVIIPNDTIPLHDNELDPSEELVFQPDQLEQYAYTEE